MNAERSKESATTSLAVLAADYEWQHKVAPDAQKLLIAEHQARITHVTNVLTELALAAEEVHRISERKHEAWDRLRNALTCVGGIA